ncbi:hypothetical protein EKO27_g7531 [Xylaria grammica]|uniref:Intradiol ring-cleavage dioxygenases domain-containing protein n=1 Tax=Xylaria grammica TaxID=363999 RepID=A0A439CZE4_9PEZI|nr:hypothetical protein EKO27_g7531 [Xylaria grammica]
MRALYSGFVLLALGALSPVQADTYNLYNQPVKRSLLQDLLDKLNRGNGGKGGDDGVQTVTETVRQTITVGAGGGLGGVFNTSASTTTATATITVTQVAKGTTDDGYGGDDYDDDATHRLRDSFWDPDPTGRGFVYRIFCGPSRLVRGSRAFLNSGHFFIRSGHFDIRGRNDLLTRFDTCRC